MTHQSALFLPLKPQPQRHGLGIFLILLMAACFAALDTSVKYLSAAVPVLMLLWARYAFQAIAMGSWLLLRPGPGFRVAHPKFQLARGALLMTASVMSFRCGWRWPTAASRR